MKIAKECKRVAALFLAAFLLVTVKPVEVKAAYNNEVTDGVVAIVIYAEGQLGYAVDGQFVPVQDFSGPYSSGSGFFVGAEGKNPQYIVTNCHVIDDYVSFGEGAEGYYYMGEDDYGSVYFG